MGKDPNYNSIMEPLMGIIKILNSEGIIEILSYKEVNSFRSLIMLAISKEGTITSGYIFYFLLI